MGLWDYKSYDADDDDAKDYNGKTVHEKDGSVNSYRTNNDWKGHSHTHYDNKDDHFRDKPSSERGINHPDSRDRNWKDYILQTLNELSFIQLQMLESTTTNDYIKHSARLMMSQSQGRCRIR